MKSLPPNKPSILKISGHPATGKSTVAQRIMNALCNRGLLCNTYPVGTDASGQIEKKVLRWIDSNRCKDDLSIIVKDVPEANFQMEFLHGRHAWADMWMLGLLTDEFDTSKGSARRVFADRPHHPCNEDKPLSNCMIVIDYPATTKEA